MTEFTDHLWQDLVREHGASLAEREPGVKRRGPSRVTVFAGSGLGLAAVAVGALLAVGGTAASSPAVAVAEQSNGSVLVTVNLAETTQPWVQDADDKLAAMGINESIWVTPSSSASASTTPAGSERPVTCLAAAGGGSTPSGPPIQVRFVGTVPAGVTGAATMHNLGCAVAAGSQTPGADSGGAGNS